MTAQSGPNAGRSGSDTTVCSECGDLLYYDYSQELWLHKRDDTEECIDTGKND